MNRKEWIEKLFPGGAPKLFCPPVTHFCGPMTVDKQRTLAHYRFMAPNVGGFLIPGTTGDGWAFSDEQVISLLRMQCENATAYGGRILAGVLKPEVEQMLAGIRALRDEVGRITGDDGTEGFLRMGLCGVTVCAPSGKDRTQKEMTAALSRILELGLPTALYQLPQVTQNEMSPETVAALAKDYPNFFLFKDTSGNDAVAKSGLDFGGVLLVRGAEGDYAQWYKGSGGVYDGFLLSTANAFAPELCEIIRLADSGDIEGARGLSGRLSGLIGNLLELGGHIAQSNAFANAAKMTDHLNAFGGKWEENPAPMLPDGERIPMEMVRKAAGLVAEVFPGARMAYYL